MKMNVKPFSKTRGGQDGAILGNLMFRFNSHGLCRVYDMKAVKAFENQEAVLPICEFSLEKLDIVDPHSNAVFFGKEYFEDGDEFPILYTNIYNNYAKQEDRREGMLAMYRIMRADESFSSQLLGVIEVGFNKDTELWRSANGEKDVRPYGNFIYDSVNDRLYAYVMRDLDKTTRYFAFDMPSFKDSKYDESLGTNKVVLEKEDLIEYFDTPYHNFIQGAAMRNGLVYSVEGFGEKVHPGIRVIDTKNKEQALYCDFYELGYVLEAEFIDFYEECCIYGDAHGNLFELVFE